MARVLPALNPLTYPNNRWRCPITGAVVPKGRRANYDKRVEIHQKCLADPTQQEAYILGCRDSFLLWANLFGWSFKPVYHSSTGRGLERGDRDRMFISWPGFDAAAEQVIEVMETGGKAAVEKSREVLASWLTAFIATWRFLFYQGSSVLLVSRKQEEVDSSGRVKLTPESTVVPGDPDTLFWKIDYIIHHLPPWMKPRIARTYMHMQNLDIGAVIDGESTNDDVGRGGRRDLAIVDEAAAIENLKDIDRSLSDTATAALYVSTPKAGRYFSTLCFSPAVRRITMGWWDVPEKASDAPDGTPGREVVFDASRNATVIDGPWRRSEKSKRADPQDIAENIDIDHEAAGKVVFDLSILSRHKGLYACYPPTHRGDLVFTDEGSVRDLKLGRRDLSCVSFKQARPGEHAGWRLWTGLQPDSHGMLRPPQNMTVILAADISMGVGASNSVISAGNFDTGELIAEFASARHGPEELARILVAAGHWFGGTKGFAYLIWEANGPGEAVAKIIVGQIGYPWYYRRVTSTTGHDKPNDNAGFWKDRRSVHTLAVELREAYATDRFINRSPEAIEETVGWVRYDNGDIGPGGLEFESPDARATHGDRTISNMLLVHAFTRCHYAPTPIHKPPVGSVARELLDERRARAVR